MRTDPGSTSERDAGPSGASGPGVPAGSAHALGEIIATAVVTSALVPFAQTLAQKAAEDTYTAVRGWLREVFRSAEAKRVPPGERHRELLIVQDLDPKLQASLYLPTDASDEALRALERLDIGEEIATARRGEPAKIRVYWDERTGTWRAGT
ncbi:hypothetical protein [Streptomyces sp. AK02-01A]|uniref:hypothetical protein n=1 Tax=Streptomyces sp. AK02-01A TaxID=3028648 RepID=UPI0029A525D2|nr:hypothetical protein [Streptomyces sp. AK02-01A]MDX3849306.1 hypothetical protein [Streptomyces sp. AK02-01A]